MTFLVALYCSHQLVATNPGVINGDCSNLEVGKSICLGFVNENCTTIHTVEIGDTCQKIASESQISMNVLRMNNPQLDQACGIYAGEVRVFFLFVFPSCHIFWGFNTVDSGLLIQTPRY
jgi:hypothetical protein